jgi:hypothetical protein
MGSRLLRIRDLNGTHFKSNNKLLEYHRLLTGTHLLNEARRRHRTLLITHEGELTLALGGVGDRSARRAASCTVNGSTGDIALVCMGLTAAVGHLEGNGGSRQENAPS